MQSVLVWCIIHSQTHDESVIERLLCVQFSIRIPIAKCDKYFLVSSSIPEGPSKSVFHGAVHTAVRNVQFVEQLNVLNFSRGMCDKRLPFFVSSISAGPSKSVPTSAFTIYGHPKRIDNLAVFCVKGCL